MGRAQLLRFEDIHAEGYANLERGEGSGRWAMMGLKKPVLVRVKEVAIGY